MNFPTEQLQNIQTKVTETVQTVTNNEKVKQFVMFIMTVAAVIVGVAQFVKRSWVQNDMNSKLLKMTQTVLVFVSTTADKVSLYIEEKELAV